MARDKFLNLSADTGKQWVDQPTMYTNLLNVTQGTFGSASQVDLVRPAAPATLSKLVSGRVVYINSSGQFQVGLAANALPFLAKPAGGYEGRPATGNTYGNGILAIPVTAGYFVQTTEHLAGNSPFAANMFLTASTADDANLGKVTPGDLYEDDILGICLDTLVSEAGRSMLEFATVFIPAIPSSVLS